MADKKTNKNIKSLFAAFCIGCFFMAVVTAAGVVMFSVLLFLYMNGLNSVDNIAIAVLSVFTTYAAILIGVLMLAANAIFTIFFIYYGYIVARARGRAERFGEIFVDREIKDALKKTAAFALAIVFISAIVIGVFYEDVLFLCLSGIVPLLSSVTFLTVNVVCAKLLKKYFCDNERNSDRKTEQ